MEILSGESGINLEPILDDITFLTSNLDKKNSSILDNSTHEIGENYHLAHIKDFDGNLHANTESVSNELKNAYKYQGKVDVNNDGFLEAIYTNKVSGRWVTGKIDNVTGAIDYDDYGAGGGTRIIGIYDDPLIAVGNANGGFLDDGVTPAPAKFGAIGSDRYLVVNGETIDRLAFNSQVRFQDDLLNDNLTLKASGDYDGDGYREVYWQVKDSDVFLRSLMHKDGNIKYANYQNKAQMINYLKGCGYETTASNILSASGVINSIHFLGKEEFSFINAGKGDDLINGGKGNDELYGNTGNDLIKGGGGNDVINGGPGNDLIEGGAGADAFIISDSSGITIVKDYDLEEDSIILNLDNFEDFSIQQYGTGFYLIKNENILAEIRNSDSSKITRDGNKIIKINDDYSNNIANSLLIKVGDKKEGELEIAGDVDYFKIYLSENENYLFNLEGISLTDPFLTLFDAAGNQIISNDDGGIGLDSRIIFTPKYTENYFMEVSSFEDDLAGSYSFFSSKVEKNESDILFSNFSSKDGYGLVNAKSAFENLLTIDIPSVSNLGGNLWGLDKIKVPEVWQAFEKKEEINGQDVIVAVVDTGVDLDHNEFKGRIVKGYDFVDNDHFADDLNGHGTHVAGTIAAANDSIGITGVAYNSKIMPIRVLDEFGRGYLSDVTKGIRFASDNGADIINLSVGSTYHSRSLYEAIKYANNKGSVVVMAAGNSGSAYPTFPAIYSMNYGISVGAVDITNDLATFSNMAGINDLDYVTAPGVNIYSSVPNNGYAFFSGTSMATPHVSGLAALLKSYDKELNPKKIENLILNSTSEGIFDYQYLSSNYSDDYQLRNLSNKDFLVTLDYENEFIT